MLRLNRKRREEKKKNSCWDEPRRDFSFFPFCNRMQTTGLGIIFPQSRKKRPPNIYRPHQSYSSQCVCVRYASIGLLGWNIISSPSTTGSSRYFFSLSLSMTVCVPAGNENGGSPVVVRLSFLIAPKSFCTLPIVQQPGRPAWPGLYGIGYSLRNVLLQLSKII